MNLNPHLGRKSFNDTRSWKAFVAVYLTALLVGVAFWAGVIYVAVHFITKFW
jgi:hypothetical protein